MVVHIQPVKYSTLRRSHLCHFLQSQGADSVLTQDELLYLATSCQEIGRDEMDVPGVRRRIIIIFAKTLITGT